MAYRCHCGNTARFYEIFDIAIDVVDGEDNFVQTKRLREHGGRAWVAKDRLGVTARVPAHETAADLRV